MNVILKIILKWYVWNMVMFWNKINLIGFGGNCLCNLLVVEIYNCLNI